MRKAKIIKINKIKIKLTLLNIKGKEVGSEKDELIINSQDIEGYVIIDEG